MWCNKSSCLLLTMPNQNHITCAQPSQEQRQLQRESALQAAEALQQDIYDTLDKIHTALERLSHEHDKSVAFILEQLHLGGNILKQKHAPGINNAYTHCETQCEDDCKFRVSHFVEKH